MKRLRINRKLIKYGTLFFLFAKRNGIIRQRHDLMNFRSREEEEESINGTVPFFFNAKKCKEITDGVRARYLLGHARI